MLEKILYRIGDIADKIIQDCIQYNINRAYCVTLKGTEFFSTIQVQNGTKKIITAYTYKGYYATETTTDNREKPTYKSYVSEEEVYRELVEDWHPLHPDTEPLQLDQVFEA